jgi:hypothetical protein
MWWPWLGGGSRGREGAGPGRETREQENTRVIIVLSISLSFFPPYLGRNVMHSFLLLVYITPYNASVRIGESLIRLKHPSRGLGINAGGNRGVKKNQLCD